MLLDAAREAEADAETDGDTAPAPGEPDRDADAARDFVVDAEREAVVETDTDVDAAPREGEAVLDPVRDADTDCERDSEPESVAINEGEGESDSVVPLMMTSRYTNDAQLQPLTGAKAYSRMAPAGTSFSVSDCT